MFSDLNAKLAQLYNEADSRKSLDIAIELANEVIKILSPSVSGLMYGEDALDNAMPASKFPNHKIESWFAGHPYFADDRVALKFFENDLVETHFYWLSDSATKARIAAGTAITPNWEDSELNQKDDSYKVGLDLFLSHDTKSLLIVATSKNNLRVLELEGKLSNTQIDIFNTIRGAFDLPVRAQVHRTIWDSLALNEVNKKFYAGIAEHFTLLIQHLGTNNYDKEDAKLFASRLLGRLLFVWFLRKKHIIDESFGYFDAEGAGSTEYYETKLKKLFFETLNTPQSERDKLSKEQQKRLFDDTNDDTQTTLLKIDRTTPYLNGGLFEAHDNDWADRTVSFPKGYFKSLFEHLEQYNFTTDESSPEYEQVAIDPEMLGRVFESLLATQLTETGDQARKAKGAFYTPREIVSYMSRESLRQYLYTKLDNPAWNEGVDKLLDTSDSDWELSHSNSKRNLWGEANRNIVPQMVITALDDLKVLDPACGSGAYPMGMLQIILKTYERLESSFDPYTRKLRIIEENIYGVDIEPMAVEISRLRAWLSIVVDSNKNPSDFKPLPNLDFKFIVANSLLPLSKDFQLGDDKFDKVRSKMQWIIGKYFNTTDKQEKASLRQEFSKQSSMLSQTSIFGEESKLQKQLHSFKPFDVHSEAIFFDAKLMFGLNSKSPFDLVIGNPPYVQLQKNGGILANMYQAVGYETFARTGDIYSLFYERGLELTKKDSGLLCYITSNKWMRAGYGESTRKYFARKNPIKLIDFGGFKVFESATVDTNILLIENRPNQQNLQAAHFKNDYKKDDSIDRYLADNSIILNGLSSETWFIGDTSELELKAKIGRIGVPLKDWGVGIYRGVLTGFNDAFIIDENTKQQLIAEDPSSVEIIRPLLRGKDIKRYGVDFKEIYLLATGYDIDIPNKYPAVYNHLKSAGDKFEEAKTKGKGLYKRDDQGKGWWNLRHCAYYDEFERDKVMWPETMRIHRTGNPNFPRFNLKPAGVYLDKTIFMMDMPNPLFFLGFINSKLGWKVIDSYIDKLDQGGYMMQKAMMQRLPVPRASDFNPAIVQSLEGLAGEALAIRARDATADIAHLEDQINQIVYQMYDLAPDEIKIIEKLG